MGLPITISQGQHEPYEKQACVMEWVSLLSEEEDYFNDSPKCTDPWLAAVAREVNDQLSSDEARAKLAPYIGKLSKAKGGTAWNPVSVLFDMFDYLAPANSKWNARPRVNTPGALQSFLVSRIRTHGNEKGGVDVFLANAAICLAALSENEEGDIATTADYLIAAATKREDADDALVELFRIALAGFEKATRVSTGRLLTKGEIADLAKRLEELDEEEPDEY